MTVVNPYNYGKPKNHVAKPALQTSANPNVKQNKAINDKMDQYLESKVLSAKPEELTYLLYDGLVKFVKKAMMSLENKSYEKVNEYSLKAQAIVSELRSTLNMDVEMSENLDKLYEYLERRLMEANIGKDIASFEEALTIAEEFRDTWRDAFNIKV